MTPARYSACIARLGWSNVEACKRLGIGDRQGRRYIAGECVIPRPVEIVLESAIDPAYLARALGLSSH